MAKYFLGGVPLDVDSTSLGLSESQKKLIRQISNRLDIAEDMAEVSAVVRLIETRISSNASGFGSHFSVGDQGFYLDDELINESLAARAIVLYSRAFRGDQQRGQGDGQVSGGGKTKLDAVKIFGGNAASFKETHDFFDGLRNSHFAHDGLRLNKPKVNFHVVNECVGLVADGGVRKALVCKSIKCWSCLEALSNIVSDALKGEIKTHWARFEQSLTAQQKCVLSSQFNGEIFACDPELTNKPE